MKLSIIIPVYNVEKYLGQCLDSVLKQTLQDFEVILVDDGSTDGSPALCDAAAEQDGRISVVHQKNRGLSAARNAGLDIAQGEWIGFIDSDDFILSDMYEKLIHAAEREHADIAVCNFMRVDGQGKPIENQRTYIEDGVLSRTEALRNVLKVAFQIAPNKVYRRHIFKDLRYPEGKLNEDFYLVTEIYKRAERVVSLSDVLYAYRVTPDSIMQKRKTLRSYDVVRASDDCFRFFLNEGMEDMLPECETATFNNLYGIYCDLSPKERHAPETKDAMELHRRELKELLKRRRLSFKSLCRAGIFYSAPMFYKKIREIKNG